MMSRQLSSGHSPKQGLDFNRAMNGYLWLSSDDQRYLAAKLPRDEGDVYVSLYVTPSGAGGGPEKG